MDARKNIDEQVYRIITNTINNCNREINSQIKELNKIKLEQKDNSQLVKRIDSTINKLNAFQSGLTASLFNYNKTKNKLNVSSFAKNNADYTYYDNKNKNAQEKIDDLRANIQSDKKNMKLREKLNNLKAKQGKIKTKQLKIADNIVKEKLLEYKKKKKINFDNISSIISEYGSNKQDRKDLKDAQKAIERKEKSIEKKINSGRNLTQNEIKQIKRNQADIDRLTKQVNGLKKKKCKFNKNAACLLIAKPKQTIIDRLKNGAKRLGKTIKNKFYEAKNDHEMSK